MAIATIAAAAVGLWLAMIGLIPAWIAVLLFLSAIPLAHGLLSLGLVDEAHKYGLSFEALNFLMTGRRDAAIAPAMSFALWAVAQSCLTLVIALGIRVVLPYRAIKQRDTRGSREIGPTILKTVFFLITALIAYGSLYPFDWHIPDPNTLVIKRERATVPRVHGPR
ncbi:MAG: hypothetical protein MZV65_27960 [Chromatiales bacterium]|nr:hypothetical protein [Chromatiales bacterium]